MLFLIYVMAQFSYFHTAHLHQLVISLMAQLGQEHNGEFTCAIEFREKVTQFLNAVASA